MRKIHTLILISTLWIAVVAVCGCGREAATPDKLYGIWMGESKSAGKVTYTFILGGKCEIEFPSAKKPLEKAKWEIIGGNAVVTRASGEVETFSLSEFDLKSEAAGVSIHKLGMEY